jgi:hypothetical protein
MLGPVGQIGYGPALPARVVAAHRAVRVVERACATRLDPRRPSDCCPSPTPAPYWCHLEERNARDRVELTFSEHLARLPDTSPVRSSACCDDRATASDRCREDARVIEGERPIEPALRGPRLGEVSPITTLPPLPPAAMLARLDVTA